MVVLEKVLVTDIYQSLRNDPDNDTRMLWKNLFQSLQMNTELNNVQKSFKRIFTKMSNSEKARDQFLQELKASMKRKPRVTTKFLESVLPRESFPRSLHRSSKSLKHISFIINYLKYMLFGVSTTSFQKQLSNYTAANTAHVRFNNDDGGAAAGSGNSKIKTTSTSRASGGGASGGGSSKIKTTSASRASGSGSSKIKTTSASRASGGGASGSGRHVRFNSDDGGCAAPSDRASGCGSSKIKTTSTSHADSGADAPSNRADGGGGAPSNRADGGGGAPSNRADDGGSPKIKTTSTSRADGGGDGARTSPQQNFMPFPVLRRSQFLSEKDYQSLLNTSKATSKVAKDHLRHRQPFQNITSTLGNELRRLGVSDRVFQKFTPEELKTPTLPVYRFHSGLIARSELPIENFKRDRLVYSSRRNKFYWLLSQREFFIETHVRRLIGENFKRMFGTDALKTETLSDNYF